MRVADNISRDWRTPTKRPNEKQLLQEENKKSGNVMQQSLHSYIYGINLRSESSLVQVVRFTFRVCTRSRQELDYRANGKYYLMRILSELVFIPQT